MSLKNINASEVRIVITLILLLVSCVIYAVNLQNRMALFEHRLEIIENCLELQNDIYFNLRSLFDRNDWNWTSSGGSNG